MRALLLLTSLITVPVVDEMPPPMPAPETVAIPVAQIQALLGDNLRLRKAVMEALEQRDQARGAAQTCVDARST
jgi:hypothetical protein